MSDVPDENRRQKRIESRGRGRGSLRGLSVVVIVIGVAVTTVLTVSSRIGYLHNEHRLTALQTQLTSSSLSAAQTDLERRLGEAEALASESASPGAEFTKNIASSMVPNGPFSVAGLRLVKGNTVTVLAHVGASPLVTLTGKAASDAYRNAAKTKSLVMTRIFGHGQQRLIFLLSLAVPQGILVASGAEALPGSRHVTIPPSSPDADLDVALYYGKTATPSGLIETNANHLPLTGTTAMVTVPLGTGFITLVTSPRGSLSGTWSEVIPWGILAVGIIFTLGIAMMTDRLVRRRQSAEHLAQEVSYLYREQRAISETLQRALLPKQLPSIPGIEFGALYLPGSAGLEVGGDWYSAIRVDDHRFTFVVGDVSGRGVSAATVMASLRYTSRAFASLGYGPSEILTMVANELDIVTDGHFATVLIGTYDARLRELTLASAGHLNPLMLEDGVARFIEVPVGVPLGVGDGPYRSITLTVAPGSTVLGFTDGLVERRDESIENGFARLATAATPPSRSVDVLLAQVVSALTGDQIDDDVALLGIRWLS